MFKEKQIFQASKYRFTDLSFLYDLICDGTTVRANDPVGRMLEHWLETNEEIPELSEVCINFGAVGDR